MKIMITGATGFVGEGVMLSCLQHPQVTEVLMVNRRPYPLQHPKLKELIVPAFMALDGYEAQLSGYDACFYCAGISSVGMNEEKYTHITYDTTLVFANKVLSLNPEIVFNFISGSHTDSSEKGKVMWARVKGKTENALMRMPFKAQYNFRPGGMKAVEGQRNTKALYKALVSIIGFLFPKAVVTLAELANAMVNAATKGYSKQVLEIKDIKALAKI
ncbi:epimerase [Mucilaginibacter pedocola]|uniref:Epimerase n=1 Tax=Mucilaginibacter pedocola TaxID=1792845 RepID=A0A1S9PDG6_9SPHI|nr:epimerase [Mucilaginibacter pedocola]